MNTGYYQMVYSGLTSLKNYLPDFLEPEERASILARINQIQAACLIQIEEMIAYDDSGQSEL